MTAVLLPLFAVRRNLVPLPYLFTVINPLLNNSPSCALRTFHLVCAVTDNDEYVAHALDALSMQMHTNRMKLPSPVEMQLLALVAHGELSGREVAKMYEQETGKSMSYGTLYTTFRRLIESGWVKARDDEDEDGRVRFFKIDVDGRKALAEGRDYYAGIASFGLPEGRLA